MGIKKAIIWPVAASIFIHVTLLAVSGMIDLRNSIKPVDMFSVSIKEPEPENIASPEKETKINQKQKANPLPKEKGYKSSEDGWREETIDLGSMDVKYVSYLAKIKNKILKVWKYPDKSYERNEEGNVVVKMSIDADGSLSDVSLIASSGFVELDHGALDVVQSAAPYEPLPKIYNLSRLHIMASFYYKIME